MVSVRIFRYVSIIKFVVMFDLVLTKGKGYTVILKRVKKKKVY